MKFEKINENQIRCILTKEDLEARHIKLSELAYGSSKANDLFREMVQQAARDYGFEVNDIPLMVEAIPARTGNLELVISKVEYPDELDPRFSRFSEPGEEFLEESEKTADHLSKQGASDILDLFREMKDAAESFEENKKEPVENKKAENKKAEKTSDAAKTADRASALRADADLVSVFEFDHMETILHLALVLKHIYHGQNDLYKLEKGRGGYFILMHKNDHTPEQFNKICNITSEYGVQKPYLSSMKAYFEEHSKLIRRGDALQMLAAVAE